MLNLLLKQVFRAVGSKTERARPGWGIGGGRSPQTYRAVSEVSEWATGKV